jgi:hypothetical protein
LLNEKGNLPADDYSLKYKLKNAQWKTLILDRTVFDKLFDANESDANIIDEDIPNITFQLSGEDETNELLLFDAFEIIPITGKLTQQKPITKLRGGADFRYK